MDRKIFWKNFGGWMMLMSGLLILLFLFFYIPMIMSNPILASGEAISKQDVTTIGVFVTTIGVLVIADVVLLYFGVKWIWQTERLFGEDE